MLFEAEFYWLKYPWRNALFKHWFQYEIKNIESLFFMKKVLIENEWINYKREMISFFLLFGNLSYFLSLEILLGHLFQLISVQELLDSLGFVLGFLQNTD